ncbi:hypothetical protein J3Q64DRAFT_1697151 [Phycomyces blakesleeanus]|uniref:Uncharacterized protein n=1 Tax=Phycomyces blakesleeanus TaxID=4837 RepID=A0ABR3B4N5_PHYBL
MPPKRNATVVEDTNNEPIWFKKFKEEHFARMKEAVKEIKCKNQRDSEKEKKSDIRDFIMNNVVEIDEDRASKLLYILKKNSLKAYQFFALKDDSNGKANSEKEWKDLDGEDRMHLVMSTLQKLVKEARELEVLNLSCGLWVVEFLVQPKWSNMSRNRRRNK